MMNMKTMQEKMEVSTNSLFCERNFRNRTFKPNSHPSAAESDQSPGPFHDCLVEGNVDEDQDEQGHHVQEHDGQHHCQDDEHRILPKLS